MIVEMCFCVGMTVAGKVKGKLKCFGKSETMPEGLMDEGAAGLERLFTSFTRTVWRGGLSLTVGQLEGSLNCLQHVGVSQAEVKWKCLPGCDLL